MRIFFLNSSSSLLLISGLGPALPCVHVCRIASFSKRCFVCVQTFNLHNLDCFHSSHTEKSVEAGNGEFLGSTVTGCSLVL